MLKIHHGTLKYGLIDTVGETGYERNTGMVVTVNFSPYVVNARPRDYLSTFLVCSRIFHQFSEATGSHTKIL